MKKAAHIFSAAALAATLWFPALAQAMLINGDFETGDLSGWTTFTTANGTLGNGGAVTLFDTTGGGASLAATFNVGQVSFVDGVPAGGGIFQSVALAAGNYTLSADIAAFNAPSTNASGGIFDLLFDNVVVDTLDFGIINGTERGLLASLVNVTAGVHEVRLRMQRPFLRDTNTPYQYLDNIVLRGDTPTVPAPATLALVALGLLCLRRRTAA